MVWLTPICAPAGRLFLEMAMTTKIKKFHLNTGWYRSSEEVRLCGAATRKYLDVGNRFHMHVSTTKPRNNEYYELVRVPHNRWEIADLPSGTYSISPWIESVDHWMSKVFPKEKRLYAWATV